MNLAEKTLDLCRISSVTRFEAELADHVQQEVARLAPHAHVQRHGNAVVVTPPSKPGLPLIGFFGHLDTVPHASEQPLEIREDRVFGCGASDMKGGVAVMMGLLEQADAMKKANAVFVFYDKEEGPAADSGLPPLFEAEFIPRGIDLAFCLEPTDLKLQLGCMGGIQAHVVFKGQRAHSARPWHGVNAIYKALPFLERLEAFERREVRFGELSFFEVMTATMAFTENAQNVVPDAFTVNVNYRFAPGKLGTEAIAELVELVGGMAEVRVQDVAPAGDVCQDHPLLDPWRAKLGLALDAKQAWTDVAMLTSRGIPAVNFGPGEVSQAHQANESIPVSNLEACFKALGELVGL